MRWLRRKRRSAAGSLDRAADGSDVAHLEDFARTRRGVEASHDLARKLAIPVYDAQVVGYPQRMRDWSRRHGQG